MAVFDIRTIVECSPQFGQTERQATPQGFSTPDLTVQPAPDINAIAGQIADGSLAAACPIALA